MGWPLGKEIKKEEVMEAKLIDVITNDTIRLYGLNEEALFFLKTDYAKLYLQERFAQDPHIVDALLKHPAFWTWWRELWADRDRNLLKRSAFREYGFTYTYPIGKFVELPNGDGYQPTET